MIICGRCGLHHYADAWCGARNAKCLKCFKYGHFARVCRTSVTDPAVCYTMQIKKNRDTERMTAFLRRKDFENLPFNMLTNTEMQSMRFNSLRRHHTGSSRKQKQEKEILCGKVGGLEASVSYLRVENADIKTNLKSSEDRIKRVMKENNEVLSASRKTDNRVKQLLAQTEMLQSQNEQYRKTINKQEVETGELHRENHKMTCKLDNANASIQNLRLEMKNMDIEVQQLRTENTNINTKLGSSQNDSATINKLTAKNEELFKDNIRLSEFRYQLESANKELTKLRNAEKLKERDLEEKRQAVESRNITIRKLEETITSQHSVIRMSTTDIANLASFNSETRDDRAKSRQGKCTKCGSSFVHNRDACSVNLVGSKCVVCRSRNNHFTVCCRYLKFD